MLREVCLKKGVDQRFCVFCIIFEKHWKKLRTNKKCQEIKQKPNILKILTWNVRGLRQEDRTREILKYVGNQGNDIIMLQETHFRNERGGAVQREWTWRPLLWTDKPDGMGGVGLLVRSRSEGK